MSDNDTPSTGVRVYTIGFTKKSAREFFGKLGDAQVRTVLDIRLNNVSQLAGFAKKPDLEYFLASILRAHHREDPGHFEWDVAIRTSLLVATRGY